MLVGASLRRLKLAEDLFVFAACFTEELVS